MHMRQVEGPLIRKPTHAGSEEQVPGSEQAVGAHMCWTAARKHPQQGCGAEQESNDWNHPACRLGAECWTTFVGAGTLAGRVAQHLVISSRIHSRGEGPYGTSAGRIDQLVSVAR